MFRAESEERGAAPVRERQGPMSKTTRLVTTTGTCHPTSHLGIANVEIKSGEGVERARFTDAALGTEVCLQLVAQELDLLYNLVHGVMRCSR